MAYRWEHPYDWLVDAAQEWSKERLYAELCNLARRCGGDTLQDEYEADMVADGYFLHYVPRRESEET